MYPAQTFSYWSLHLTRLLYLLSVVRFCCELLRYCHHPQNPQPNSWPTKSSWSPKSLKWSWSSQWRREGDRNKVSSWGSGREFIGRFIVNINLGATQAETKAVIFHSSSLFMDPPSTASKNTNSYYYSHTCWEGMVLFSHGRTVLHSDHLSIIIFDGVESRHFIQGF